MASIEPVYPAAAGSYLLWFYLPRRAYLAVGRGRRHLFQRGWYLYCGSAFGPGGLNARLRHHQSTSPRPHWHIDYLKNAAQLRAVWFCLGRNSEHEWSAGLASLAGASLPCPGFGASDCRCPSHLIYFRRQPKSGDLLPILGGEGRIFRRRIV